MNETLGHIDHGPRSNDSAFGGLEPDANASPIAAVQGNSEPNVVVSERLPFTVGLIESESQLLRVQALRASAYGHHLPELAATFSKPDPIDRLEDVTIFCAVDKATGQFVGSARIQTNLGGPLQIERSLTLPAERRGQLLCEITRLAVAPGYPHPVRLALVKALHLFCIANQIGGVVAGSRRSLLRIYLDLGFSDLYRDNRMVPLAHGGGLEHRILFRDTVTSEAEGRARNHRDYLFVFRTYHPDIHVFDSILRPSHRALGEQVHHRKAA